MAKTGRRNQNTTDPKTMIPVKTAVTLSYESHRRIRAAAIADGMTMSEVMEGLVNKHLSAYYVVGPKTAGESQTSELKAVS